MKVPKDFPKWSKKTDSVEDAGQWALECERSRLPDDMAVPRAGQVWETLRDCEVGFRACIVPSFPPPTVAGLPKGFADMLTPELHDLLVRGGIARLRQGDRVCIP